MVKHTSKILVFLINFKCHMMFLLLSCESLRSINQPYSFYLRNKTGSRYNQSEIVSRNRELNKYVDKMDELMEKRLEMRRGDVDLKAGLRMAGWRIERKYDEALECYRFDFENAVEPDAISAVQYGMTASGTLYSMFSFL